MANAFVALGAVTLTSSDSSVTFHNIPSIYEDLYLSIVGTLTGSAIMYVRLNSDVGPNYRYVSGAGDNANGLYQESSTQTYIPNAPAFATSTAFQADYEIIGAGSARYKNALVHYAMNGQSLNIVSSTWRNTGVVQTVEALLSANSYAAGTTLRLFGVIA
jgi:hypothetical protein